MGDDGVAGRHRLDQRRVGAADGVPVQVERGVEAQRLQALGLEDRAGEDDLVGRGGLDPHVVRIVVAVRADHDQRHAALLAPTTR